MDEQGQLYKQKQREELKITHEELGLERSQDYLNIPQEQMQRVQTKKQPEENYFPITSRMEIENRLQQPTKDQKVRRAFDAAQDQIYSPNTTFFYDGSARREINEKIQKNKDLHSEKLLETITLARQLTGLEPVAMNSLSYLPSATVLHSEYKAKDLKLSAKKRAEKLENKKSRLYQKRVVAGQILQAEANNIAAGLQMMEAVMAKDQVLGNDQEVMDLAAFMTTDKATNERMIKAYFCTGGDPRTMNREAVLDGMTQMLFTINIGSLRLDNDQEMAKNAPMLEMVVRQVDAFDRLAKENNYLEGLNERMRSDVELKLSQLRSIAFYYNARKEIISDPYYMSHYNEELTMDITKEPTAAEKKDPEELERRKAMSEKLLKAYVAGRVMMEKNGVDSDLIRKMGMPKFADKALGEQFVNYYREEFQKEETQKNALAESYQTKLKQQWACDQLSRVKRKAADTSYQDELYSMAYKNATEYQGEAFMKADYKEPEYSEQKMAEYLQELSEIQAGQVSYGSIASLVRDYNENHALCARVKFLHRQICRGIANGYPIDDKQLVSIRAKTSFFALMDATGSLVNSALLGDKSMAYHTDEQWKEYLQKSIKTLINDGAHLFSGDLFGVVGDPMALFANCEKYAKQEDAEKDKTIKTVWQYLGKGKYGEEIPEEELKRMRAEYNRNAVMDDFFYYVHFSLKEGRDASSLMMAHLKAQEVERAKKEHRNPNQNLRMDYGFCHYLSADDIQKSLKLSLSEKPEDKYEHYKRFIEECKKFSIDELDIANMPKLLENFDQKERVMRMQLDNLYDAAKELSDAANQMSDEPTEEDKLHLSGAPLDYYDKAQMLRDARVLHNFSCYYLSGRANGLTQIENTKYQHVLSYKERVSMKDEDFRKYNERKNYILNEVLEGEDTEESLRIDAVIKKIENCICPPKDGDANHHYTPTEEPLDYLYRQERRRVDKEMNYYEKQDEYYDQWDRDFQEAVVPGYLEEKKEQIKESAGDIMAVKNYYRERAVKSLNKIGLTDISEGRWGRAYAGTLVYLSEQDPAQEKLDMDRTLKALCATEKDFKDEELHREKNRLLEQAMDVFLNLDMKELEFHDYHDFLNFDQTKYSMITHMAFETHPSNILRTYIQDLSGDNAQELCARTKEDIKEVLLRKDFVQCFNIFHNLLIPFLSTESAKNFDVFELMEKDMDSAMKELDELIKDQKITNEDLGTLTYLVAGLEKFKNEDHITPGMDMNKAYQEYRKENWNKSIYNLD